MTIANHNHMPHRFEAVSAAETPTEKRVNLAALIFPMTSAVAFGAGVTPVLSSDTLSEHAAYLIPLVVIASLAVGAVAAWMLGPKMRAKLHDTFRRRSAPE